MEYQTVEDQLYSKLSKADIDWLHANSFSGDLQKEMVKIAKDKNTIQRIDEIVKSIPTSHRLYLADARKMDMIDDESVHLIVTSPPYWTLKKYKKEEGQLGVIKDYKKFLSELDKVWEECHRVLVPGGRLVVIVGDVCLPRRRYGRHMVVPLHADIQRHCVDLGYENLTPIFWYKIANVNREVSGRNGFLGKPYEPNAIVKNDIEYILMFRKPGYRKPSLIKRKLSIIPEESFKEWFRQVWMLRGESTKYHPAPFPLELAERLIRMFSFVDDTVLDPFIGTGTTTIAAIRCGRNSIGIEVDQEFFEFAKRRIVNEASKLFTKVIFKAIRR
ncbi:MAG: methyltransferase domain-containing protein [Archaeoglobus sp.]|nr:methyltransferase domain-containing protein [Archaeoglobus sp.]